MTTFLEDWRRHYGEAPPLSYVLPKDERWVRFHALPENKRYAEAPTEDAEVLRRANILADETLEDEPCWLAQLGAVELGWPKDAERWRTAFGLSPAGEIVHDEVLWPVFAARTSFRVCAFDGLLRDVAGDNAFRTLWLNATNGRVFAPYDGGFDIFLENRTSAAALKAKHKAWLSHRADGL